ncbi:MAG: hypothetical protein ACRDSS_02925 [Actinocrinis sp.]
MQFTHAVARLSRVRREACSLTAVAGFCYTQAAAACNGPVGTIRGPAARARRQPLGALESDDSEFRPPRDASFGAAPVDAEGPEHC